MRETSLETGYSLTKEQKCAALEAVLHSQTFARADQLRIFLKYICEMEMAGRGGELTEYVIGIEALGRPASYSPGDDSAVRTRAFALRKKLQDFYHEEQPQSPLRIELLKGSYCPHFIEVSPPPKAHNNEASTESLTQPETPTAIALEELPLIETAGKHEWKRSWLFPFSAGVMLTAFIAGGLYWWLSTRSVASDVSHSPPSILAEAWGPLLMPNAEVLLCVANPPAFSVLPGPFSPPPPQLPLSGERPLPRDLYELYATRYPATTNLSLTMTTNAAYWGDVLGALTAFKTLNAAGVAPQMFPEMVTSMPTLRHRNVILFGAPAYSATVTRFLENCPLQVKYLDAIISSNAEQSTAERYGLIRDQNQRLTLVFGLITVLPGEISGNHQNRIIIFSGVNSAGAQAAAEFFSSPEHLLEFKKELKKAGQESFPPAYQIVVKAKTDDSILLNFAYETCRIFQPSANHGMNVIRDTR
ncbi:MAG: hypothetical protein JST84_23495 [Acidobacteria bacterium]|nr:hypothetical protein [Acidobacteriota bacterium]